MISSAELVILKPYLGRFLIKAVLLKTIERANCPSSAIANNVRVNLSGANLTVDENILNCL